MFRLLILVLGFVYLPELNAAESGIPALKMTTANDGSQEYSVTLQI